MNWSSIHALFVSKRCPFAPLLTPFWSRSKHLLRAISVILWQPLAYKRNKITWFLDFLPIFILMFVRIFWEPHPPAPSPAERGSAGNSSLRSELKTSLTYWGTSHFTPLPMGEGLGGGAAISLFLSLHNSQEYCKFARNNSLPSI